MPDIFDRLKTALADRYTIEHELGAGAMATVYLAEDLKHHRKVAVKVLRPELAAAIGPERFLREIEIAANLTHPHILPLFDSGEADGFLYYAMPYIEGESLRDRLVREKQLAVDDAIEITRQVARALSYAHARNVVHRDIKPENILLAGGEAVVADFGIAKAIQAAGGESLTETGMAVGTPAYMSPEQAVGTRDLDGRSDLYGLGCVLYETLAGQAPFTGPTVESIVHQHLTADVPSVTVIREAVPPEIADAIQRVMAKTPADRFATASEFANALVPVVVTPATGSIARAAPPRQWRIGLVAASVAVVLAVAAVLGILRLTSAPAPPLDPNLVAVVPFRVSARDASLQYLAEGMVDLLAAKLAGDGGPRAVTPGLVLRAWSQMGSADEGGGEDIGMLTAANVGAGLLLSGGVVQEQNRLLINATLLAVPGGDVRGQTSVGGPPDSLTTLVDRLTAELLSLQAGQEVGRLAALTSTSLPALRAYLQGQAASRGGRYNEARDHLHRALDLDSTFALAGLTAALNWGGRSLRGQRSAWQHRDRLSQRDRILLTALVGENPSVTRSRAEQLAAWEVGVRLASDQPRAWIELGEILFHYGRVMGLNAPMERGAAAFNRALALDSSLATPLQHMMEIATLAGNEAEVQRLGTSFLALDPPAAADGYVRWHMAHVLNDSAAINRIRRGLDTLSNRSLLEIVQIGQWFGFGIEDVVRATEIRLSRAGTETARNSWLSYTATVAHNRGRPTEALAARLASQQLDPTPARIANTHQQAILDGLYSNGDSVFAAQAVRQRAPHADAPLSRTAEGRWPQIDDICIVEQWRLWHGQVASVHDAVSKLRSFVAPGDASNNVVRAHYCATLLDGMAAVVEGRADADEAVGRLDSLFQTGVSPSSWLGKVSPLVLSRLYEAIGDVPGALAAIRRRLIYGLGPAEHFSSYVREEGRLAALVGDREGAIRAYQHYLALRDDPEPSVQPEVDAVRAELATLVGEIAR